jgi:uncharacterized protein (DUF2141 family)
MKQCFFAAALLLGTAATAADGPNLRIVATNIKSDKGKLYVWVYDKKDDWLSDRYRTQKSVEVAGSRAGDRVTVELLLPAGEYALSVFQDVDDNGKLERNFIGIPKEPAGLSNNLRPRFGPPKYKDAAFTVAVGAVTEQKIELR